MNCKNFIPGADLYHKVRQGFVGQRTSLNNWCITNGVTRQAAEASLKGMYDGPKSRALRARIVEAAQIDTSTVDAESQPRSKAS